MKRNKLILFFILLIFCFFIIKEVSYYIPRYIDSILYHLIEYNEKRGNFKTVENLYKKKITFETLCFGKSKDPLEQEKIAYTENDLIHFYLSQNLYDKAEPYFLKKFEYKLIIPTSGIAYLGNKNLNAAEVYYSMAILYLNMEKYEKAKQYIQKSLKILTNENIKKDEFQTVNENIALCYTLLGTIAALEGKNPNYWFQKTILFLENNETKTTYPIFNLYYDMSVYYSNKKDYKNAEKYALKMYNVLPLRTLPFSSLVNQQGHFLAQIYRRLGKIYQNTKRNKEAERMFLNSYFLNKEIYGDYDPETVCSAYYKTEIYSKLNKKDDFNSNLKDLLQNASKCLILSDIDYKNYKEKMNAFCN